MSERVVEKIVYKDGLSEEKLQEMQERAAKERAEIEEKAKSEVHRIKLEQEQAQREKRAMEEAISKEREEAQKQEKAREMLKKKLKAMENKLLIGGELMDKAAKQEYELRQAQIELEERRRQEQELARELAEREEATMMVEEQFASLQEEVDVKTKKLRKLWNKFQSAKTEIQDLQEEFGREREDMLDTIRDLTRQLKLKDMILDNFVPPDEVEQLHRRATWNEEDENWQVARMDLAGNKLRARRPVSATGLRRPESEFARHRKQYDSNPRYRQDNIVNFDLDMPARTTQDYEGPAMSQRVQAALNAALVGEEDEVTFQPPENLPNASNFNPYLNYNGDEPSTTGGASRREYSDEGRTKNPKKSRRPRTADRRRRRGDRESEGKKSHDDDIDAMLERESVQRDAESEYPTSRGLVRR
jgi:kinesin family member 3B